MDASPPSKAPRGRRSGAAAAEHSDDDDEGGDGESVAWAKGGGGGKGVCPSGLRDDVDSFWSKMQRTVCGAGGS